jgi:hypothetical protein
MKFPLMFGTRESSPSSARKLPSSRRRTRAFGPISRWRCFSTGRSSERVG